METALSRAGDRFEFEPRLQDRRVPRTVEDQAWSQSLGHEYVGDTLKSYGLLVRTRTLKKRVERDCSRIQLTTG
jgi:hypothetical protein